MDLSKEEKEHALKLIKHLPKEGWEQVYRWDGLFCYMYENRDRTFYVRMDGKKTVVVE